MGDVRLIAPWLAAALVGLLAAVRSPQDPPRAAAPAGAAPLPPVEDAPWSPVERKDLLQRFAPESPLEGHYRLRRMVAGGRQAGEASEGYLVFGRRHLSLHLELRDGERTVGVQAGYRRYRLDGDQLVTTSLVGHSDRVGDEAVLDRPGLTETRRIELAGSVLRVYQGPLDFMEFARIE